MKILSLSFCFITFKVSRSTTQVVLGSSFIWSVWGFSYSYTVLLSFREESHRDEVSFWSHCISDMWYWHDSSLSVDFGHLTQVVLGSVWSYWKPLLYPYSLQISAYFSLCKSLHKAHASRVGKDLAPLTVGGLSTSIIWNKPRWKIDLFSHIYLFSYLYQYGKMDI